MTDFTCCFVFSNDLSRVVLIKKKHGPAFMHGLLNGVGGKVEDSERIIAGMMRELNEEIGFIPAHMAQVQFVLAYTHKIGKEINRIFFYAFLHTHNDELGALLPNKNDVGEDVLILKYDDMHIWPPMVSNLKWLIPLAKWGLDNAIDGEGLFEERGQK